MRSEPTALPGVLLITPDVFGDSRGYFLESWQQSKYAAAGIGPHFVQDNQSGSVRHTLRGLHYQVPSPQGKLVRVVAGSVFDVAVDIRRASPTFGKWCGYELSAENRRQLWVPEGLAHGFLVLSDFAEFQYKCTEFYAPSHERAIRWNDPELAIDWPLPAGAAPLLSPRDANAALFRDAECFP
jgi:dTDP-4-dehydrorhamnose 3,5-epimerase